MNIDLVHHLRDLQEVYPDPPHEMVCGENCDLIHHGYGFGACILVQEAVKECLDIAKARKDTAAVAHLQQHLKEMKQYLDASKAWREATSPQRVRTPGVAKI